MKDKRIWEIKQAADPSTLDMYIYGDVKGSYFDYWEWEQVESETSANHFREELSKYPNVTKINIYINSYGGSVFEGTAIYSQLKRHSAYKTVYIDGFACSIASVIAMAGDKVVMPSNTMLMIHNALNGVFGNSKQLRKAADDLDVIMDGNRQAYMKKTNGKISEDKLMELLEAETWLTAEQCIEYGFADELLEKDVDLSDAKQMLQKVNKTFEQQLSYNKALVAQAREFVQVVKEPVELEDPKAVEEPEQIIEPKEPKENKPKKLMAALFRQ